MPSWKSSLIRDSISLYQGNSKTSDEDTWTLDSTTTFNGKQNVTINHMKNEYLHKFIKLTLQKKK